LNKLKPALYDLVTCYLPRLVLKYRTGCVPKTAEEAVFHYAETEPAERGDILKDFLAKYGGINLDRLKRTMSDDVFDEMWPFLRYEIQRLKLQQEHSHF
jgi:hypothetical protein